MKISKWRITGLNTVEPRYKEVLGTIKITLVISGFSLYQGKKKKTKELGPAKLPCYKRVLLHIRPLYNEVPLYWQNLTNGGLFNGPKLQRSHSKQSAKAPNTRLQTAQRGHCSTTVHKNTNINIHLRKHLFTLLWVKLERVHDDDCMLTWCVWLPWISMGLLHKSFTRKKLWQS